MYVVFNTIGSGLGNNGGTRTLILCASTLERIGIRCDIATHVDNFTWFSHKKPINNIPKEADVVIATAWTTVKSTMACDNNIKAWYIRGHEVWGCSEDRLGHFYRAGLHNITNSHGLQRKIESLGASADVVHQGIDIDKWKDLNLRTNQTITIGCLNQRKSTKRWKDFKMLSKILGNKGYRYLSFGTDSCNDDFINTYYKSPRTFEELSNIYSQCDIWFAPTELEGLHNVPLEAALCGCLILSSDHPMNGMYYDYANEENAMVYKSRDIEHAVYQVINADYNKVEKMQKFIKENIGCREKSMKRFITILNNKYKV